MPLEVLVPGPATTVQDLGRPGFGAYGVPEGGAMDRGLITRANRLAGNPDRTPALEFALKGPALRWRGRASLRCVVAGDTTTEVVLAPGEELVSATLRQRAYGYIAVRGGFDVPLVMGGRGTCLPGGFGGFLGRELQVGDTLEAGSTKRSSPVIATADVSSSAAVSSSATTASPSAPFVTARVFPGDRPGGRGRAFQALLAAEWRAGAGNRVGVRLEGRRWSRPLHLSQPIPPGAVQVTGAGQPILLLRDHPTIGGYPVVAVVVAQDLDACGQLRPGQRIRFERA